MLGLCNYFYSCYHERCLQQAWHINTTFVLWWKQLTHIYSTGRWESLLVINLRPDVHSLVAIWRMFSSTVIFMVFVGCLHLTVLTACTVWTIKNHVLSIQFRTTITSSDFALLRRETCYIETELSEYTTASDPDWCKSFFFLLGFYMYTVLICAAHNNILNICIFFLLNMQKKRLTA